MNPIDILHLKYLIVTGLGKTNKSLHLCRNEAHLAAQLVPPIHIVQMEGRCPHHTIYTLHHRRAARLVGSLYPARDLSEAAIRLLCRNLPRMRHCLPPPAPFSLPASHYVWLGERQREAIIMNLYDIKLASSPLTGQTRGHECHWKLLVKSPYDENCN